ncbi:hypothetical protein LTR56_006941 [Elasticomyces elasticus]|nr:hypothetical protein LTR22_021543 [Elasticomyces elasticus]KAK3649465.1 hypothetical protein LTR56_006941 [Elasticomyces elasticus]KAK4917011.1 hypothetical protein LTR49_015048 [Elasticomyces elasticus]KAK5748976.1 hypothetical protein LTS12_020941 [Elasticomyces elasticus]
MATRRPPSICLACQVRQVIVSRRRPHVPRRRRLGTLAVVPERGNDISHGAIVRNRRAIERRGQGPSAVTVSTALPAWQLEEQPADVQEAFRSLEELWKTKHLRIPILSGLSNPWPKERHARPHNEKRPAPTKLVLPESNAAPISHANFRSTLALAVTDKLTRSVLRAQLLRCQNPPDVLRIVATALTMSKQTRQSLEALHEPIVRALYRCRDQVDDTAVLRTVNGIYSRYRVYGVHFDDQLLAFGLKFSARCRGLHNMKRYLRAIRKMGIGMTSNVFRATIAKFSIGHRGLGEIRNGRWQRGDLLQVLLGFDDCASLPREEQFHLGTFLVRDDWQYLHGWIAALARCKAVDVMWEEWMMWKNCQARRKARKLASISPSMTTKTRGDYWFVEQMTYSGGLKEAWAMVEETDSDLGRLKDRIMFRLLDGVEYCSAKVWEEQGDAIRARLVRKWDVELGKIEKAFGVSWVPTSLEDEGEGYHVLFEDQEKVLEAMSSDSFKLEEDYGYPYEGVVPEKERWVHDALEIEETKGGEDG